MEQSTFLWEEHPANLSPSLDSEKDWMTLVATSCLPILQLLQSISPPGLFGKMSQGFYQVTEDTTLPHYFEGWGSSGMGSPTEFLTLNTSEFHSGVGVCLLLDVLEVGNVPQRYFLTPLACQGILRRAEKRGKELPPMLRTSLELSAQEIIKD